ncbi:MAG: YbaN family protein [Andreesenia angusta]|nr:YbaN family protein [Andreesenia angusta]
MKYVYLLLGFLFLGLGLVGAVLPILPTVPFLLLASYFFTKSSDRVREWFHSTQIYKKHLKDFDENRSMPLKTKIGILALASSMLLLAFFKMHNIYGRIFIVLLIVFKYYYFFFKIETREISSD